MNASNNATLYCPCGMPVVDDLYRDEDGDVWHGECFDRDDRDAEAAQQVCEDDQEHRRESAVDRQLWQRPVRHYAAEEDGDV